MNNSEVPIEQGIRALFNLYPGTAQASQAEMKKIGIAIAMLLMSVLKFAIILYWALSPQK
ncbi:MAG: hypothetical protein RIC19_24890 [Phaeodactylibacter sp.]|uniref:hypothetical protein n=1 Tax=Phaeodactylibacter sp. TaxID=1940289 RepID=UPI0032EB7D25